MFSRKGFSLAELLVAIALIGVIILAVTSISITSQRFFGAASEESRLQDEMKIAMGHIVKNLTSGNRVYLNDMDKQTIWARIDRDALGNSNGTPADFNDDTWIAYRYFTPSAGIEQIRYYPNSGAPTSLSDPHEVIGSGFCEFEVSDVVSINDGNLVTITITDDLANPQVSLNSSVILRCMSIPAL